MLAIGDVFVHGNADAGRDEHCHCDAHIDAYADGDAFTDSDAVGNVNRNHHRNVAVANHHANADRIAVPIVFPEPDANDVADVIRDSQRHADSHEITYGDSVIQSGCLVHAKPDEHDHGDTDNDTDAHLEFCTAAQRHQHSRADGDRIANRVTLPQPDRDAHTHGNVHRRNHTDADTDGVGVRNPDGVGIFLSVADTDLDGDALRERNGDRSSYGHGYAANARSNWNGHAEPAAHRVPRQPTVSHGYADARRNGNEPAPRNFDRCVHRNSHPGRARGRQLRSCRRCCGLARPGRGSSDGDARGLRRGRRRRERRHRCRRLSGAHRKDLCRSKGIITARLGSNR
jgi:hypothetical protein